eukprot:scaffold375_cov378-Prasinococcus_capsulatus_cf.AAC.24
MTYPTYFVKNIVFGTPKGEIEGCASLVDMQNGLICEFDIRWGQLRDPTEAVLRSRFRKAEFCGVLAVLKASPGTIRKAVFVSDEDKEAAASQASKKRFYWSFKKEKMTDVPEGHPPVKQAFGHSRKSAHKEVPCVEQYGDIIAEFSGSWLSHIDFDSERFWTLNQCKSYRAIPSEKPLPSDSRFRKDLQLLKEGSGSKGDMGTRVRRPTRAAVPRAAGTEPQTVRRPRDRRDGPPPARGLGLSVKPLEASDWGTSRPCGGPRWARRAAGAGSSLLPGRGGSKGYIEWYAMSGVRGPASVAWEHARDAITNALAAAAPRMGVRGVYK